MLAMIAIFHIVRIITHQITSQWKIDRSMFYLTCGNPFHWRRGLYKNGWWFQYQDRSIHSILAMALGKRFVSWPYEKNRGGLHAPWSMKVARQKRSEICAVRVAKSKKNDLFWEHFFPDQKATKHWKGCHFFQHVDAPTRAIPHPAGCICICIYNYLQQVLVNVVFWAFSASLSSVRWRLFSQ